MKAKILAVTPRHSAYKSKQMAAKKQKLTIAGRQVDVSNLDKLLYPGRRFTKAKVIDYYIRVAPYLLPHLKDRPVTLKRFPEGVYGEFFYEKDAPAFTPSWVKKHAVPRKSTPGTKINYIMINDLPTLVWLANLTNIEIHPFLHRVPHIDRPTAMVFDCDPGEGANLLTCAHVAILLHDVLEELGLKSFAKVSGSKGLQVYVPLNTNVTYDVTQPLAQGIAELMAQRHPNLVVAKMPKAFRAKKVFIDWSQNSDFKTTVSVYSLRAKPPRPFVSFPVTWNQLKQAVEEETDKPITFDSEQALTRLEAEGDLFAPVLKLVQKLPQPLRKFFAGQQPASSLDVYSNKRNFNKTAEPKPSVRRSRQGSKRRFVIQKHAASHLHYDFRLEMHDVLKSWSVPKGLPYQDGESRLAVPTEDHPLEYLEFEGIIPKEQYGGGTVMVWDIGEYERLEGNYYKGLLRVYLNGVKLKGEWTLKRARENDRDVWRVMKTEGTARAISNKRDDQSALTKRTMAQIARDADATWQSNRTPR